MDTGGTLRPMVSYEMLGPLAAHVDGRAVNLGGARARAVLAILLVNRNTIVSVDRIVDLVWGGEFPPTAAAALQNLIARLRRLLGPDAIETRAPGYVLRVVAGAVDVERFEALVEQARTAAPREAGTFLREALGLWRGSALADLASERFAAGEIARLEELRLSALEARIEADLASGRHEAVVGELDALTAEHPYRERLHGQRILALYRSGRQVEALAGYRAARTALDEGLGIDPGPELQALEIRILQQDPALMPPTSIAEGATGLRAASTIDPGESQAPGRHRDRRPWVAAMAFLAAVALFTVMTLAPALEPRANTARSSGSTPPSAAVATSAPSSASSSGGSAQVEAGPPWTLEPPDTVLIGAHVRGLGYAFEGYFLVGTREPTGRAALWYTHSAGGPAGSWRLGPPSTVLADAILSDTISSSVVPQYVVVGRTCPPSGEECTAGAWYTPDSGAGGWKPATFTPPVPRGSQLRGAGPGGLGLVAVGVAPGPGGSTGVLWTTRDGKNWQRVLTGGDGLGPGVEDVTEGGPGLVAVGRTPNGDGEVWVSTDGSSWQSLDLGSTFRNVDLVSVTSTTGPLLVAGNGPHGVGVWESLDGWQWHATNGLPHVAAALARGIASNPPFVVLAVDGPDGPLILQTVR